MIQDYVNESEALKKMEVYYLGFGMGANAIITAFSMHPDAFKNVKRAFFVQPTTIKILSQFYVKHMKTVKANDLKNSDLEARMYNRFKVNFKDSEFFPYLSDLNIPVIFSDSKSKVLLHE
jgi:hypothetical protein